MGSLGNWTQTAYNGYGYVSSTTNALGWTSLTATNARGLVTSSVDPNGDVTATRYYADGDVNTVTNARGFTSTTTVDNRGLTTSTTDNIGNATTSSFGGGASVRNRFLAIVRRGARGKSDSGKSGCQEPFRWA